MSSDSRSVQFVGESVGKGEDAFKATSRGLGPNPPAHESGWRWSLRQAACRLLNESSEEEEEDDGWGERSSQGEGDLRPGESRVLPRTRGSHPSGLD
ncbi:UNVERIFIED_CONTAM: hypothetical protein Sangu_3014700 [Sesamum angustifolium]|uniref:Uncharacterized protein n=1 Tax=Sesamum angustifolium TaxID=2727405 RepID=A0AAW2KNX2_9LAMI